jgi:hypothetical protein
LGGDLLGRAAGALLKERVRVRFWMLAKHIVLASAYSTTF